MPRTLSVTPTPQELYCTCSGCIPWLKMAEIVCTCPFGREDGDPCDCGDYVRLAGYVSDDDDGGPISLDEGDEKNEYCPCRACTGSFVGDDTCWCVQRVMTNVCTCAEIARRVGEGPGRVAAAPHAPMINPAIDWLLGDSPDSLDDVIAQGSGPLADAYCLQRDMTLTYVPRGSGHTIIELCDSPAEVAAIVGRSIVVDMLGRLKLSEAEVEEDWMAEARAMCADLGRSHDSVGYYLLKQGGQAWAYGIQNESCGWGKIAVVVHWTNGPVVCNRFFSRDSFIDWLHENSVLFETDAPGPF